MVELAAVDDATLEQLLTLAVAHASPQEVVAPLPGAPGWTALRKAWFRAYHRSRRTGLNGAYREMTFAIRHDGELAGSARLAEVAPATLEAGIWLARRARSHGLGTEVLKVLMIEASARQAKQLVAHTTQENIGALKILQRTGAHIDVDSEGRVRAEFDLL
ncbi:MAG: GNAT family N-acetyltransferase [Candidatus Baltobacteraceae bacterium]